MPDPQNNPSQDPVEGSRVVIEGELEREGGHSKDQGQKERHSEKTTDRDRAAERGKDDT